MLPICVGASASVKQHDMSLQRPYDSPFTAREDHSTKTRDASTLVPAMERMECVCVFVCAFVCVQMYIRMHISTAIYVCLRMYSCRLNNMLLDL